MSDEKPRGCLAALFGQAGRTTPTTPPPAYRVREDFLSTAELSLFRTLEIATRGRFLVLAKVNLGDLFFSPAGNFSEWNRINRQHVDFLLCDPISVRPQLGIELDDSSHESERAQIRDAKKDAAFESSGLNLLRIERQGTYSTSELTRVIDAALQTSSVATAIPEAPRPAGSPPLCPNCAVQMVLRPGVKGRYAAFFGCANYPRCREIKPVPVA